MHRIVLCILFPCIVYDYCKAIKMQHKTLRNGRIVVFIPSHELNPQFSMRERRYLKHLMKTFVAECKACLKRILQGYLAFFQISNVSSCNLGVLVLESKRLKGCFNSLFVISTRIDYKQIQTKKTICIPCTIELVITVTASSWTSERAIRPFYLLSWMTTQNWKAVIFHLFSTFIQVIALQQN